MTPQQGIRELIEPRLAGDPLKSAIHRASRLCGLHYWRCRDIFYNKARRIEPHEIAAIADAVQRKRELDDRNEIENIKARIAKLESRLNQVDSEFYRPEIEWIGKMACRSS